MPVVSCNSLIVRSFAEEWRRKMSEDKVNKSDIDNHYINQLSSFADSVEDFETLGFCLVSVMKNRQTGQKGIFFAYKTDPILSQFEMVGVLESLKLDMLEASNKSQQKTEEDMIQDDTDIDESIDSRATVKVTKRIVH